MTLIHQGHPYLVVEESSDPGYNYFGGIPDEGQLVESARINTNSMLTGKLKIHVKLGLTGQENNCNFDEISR